MSDPDQKSEDSTDKDPSPLSLTLVSTHRVNLKHVYSFTVMQATGDVILWGQGPKTLVQGMRGNRCAFHIYNNTSDGWFKQKTVGALCKCVIVNMLPVTLDRKGELLAVSCARCHAIKLHDLSSGDTVTAFRATDGKLLGHMCHGEDGTIFVVYKRHPNDYRVLQLGCATTKFSALKSYAIGMSMGQESPKISFIPDGKLIVACSNRPSKIIRAVSVNDSGKPRKSLSASEEPVGDDEETEENSEAEKATWQHRYAFHTKHQEETKEDDDGDISPSDLLFSPVSGRLIVGDLLHNRLVVLNAEDGTQLQALPMSTPGWVEQICPYDLKWYRANRASPPSLVNRVLCGGSSGETREKSEEAPVSKTEQSEPTSSTIAVWLDNPYSAKQKQTGSFFTVH